MDFAIVAKSEAVVKQLSNLFRACKLVRTTVAVCHGIVDVNKIVAQANGKLLSLDCVGVFKRNNASDYALSKICARWCPANSAAIKAIMKKAGNWIVGKGANTKRLRPSGRTGSGPKGTFIATIGLQFPHPITGKDMSVTAPEPAKFETLLAREGKHWEETTTKRKATFLEAGMSAGEAKKRAQERGNIARILGNAKFGVLQLDVDSKVFTPRPSSYSLVRTAVRFLSARSNTRQAILDMGTGTGALLLATVYECRKKEIEVYGTGIDILPESVALAKGNSELCGLNKWVKFVECDYSKDSLPTLAEARYSVVLANPPYLSALVVNSSNSLSDEPNLATVGGNDGLTMYKTLADACQRLEKEEHCKIVVEVPGNDTLRVDGVVKIFQTAGFHFLEYGERDGYDMIRCCVFGLKEASPSTSSTQAC